MSSSSSALTGPGFFLAGIPAAAGCGDDDDDFILPLPLGIDGGGGPNTVEEYISVTLGDFFTKTY